MWDAEAFKGKASEYFRRGAEGDPDDQVIMLWLLLGLEFLLRAPIAQLNPVLLAVQRGDNPLSAAGIAVTNNRPLSIPINDVIGYLTKIYPEFDEKIAQNARWLVELRNQEMHSSESAIETAGKAEWMPRFLPVATSLAEIVKISMDDYLSTDLIAELRDYAGRTSRSAEHETENLIRQAKGFYSQLLPEEVQRRLGAVPRVLPPSFRKDCPACENRSAIVKCITPGRTSAKTYIDDDDEIEYTETFVVNDLFCAVCNLKLPSTAHLLAQGIDRTHVVRYSESRYEGWEHAVDYSDVEQYMVDNYDGPEYMDE